MSEKTQNAVPKVPCYECGKLVNLADTFIKTTKPVLRVEQGKKPICLGNVEVFYHVECFYSTHKLEGGAEA